MVTNGRLARIPCLQFRARGKRQSSSILLACYAVPREPKIRKKSLIFFNLPVKSKSGELGVGATFVDIGTVHRDSSEVTCVERLVFYLSGQYVSIERVDFIK